MATAQGQLVLLAEDDPDQRELLAEVLEFEGYRVLQAENAKGVVERLGQQPDVLLMDLHGVSSPEVSSALKDASPRPALMLLSADRQLESAAQALGADAFLSKPYDLDELLSKLRGLIDLVHPQPRA